MHGDSGFDHRLVLSRNEKALLFQSRTAVILDPIITCPFYDKKEKTSDFTINVCVPIYIYISHLI